MNVRRLCPRPVQDSSALPYSPFDHLRRITYSVHNIGGSFPPVVVADFMPDAVITHASLASVGYRYDELLDKWNIADGAADILYTANKLPDFALPGTLQVLCNYSTWLKAPDKQQCHPMFGMEEYLKDGISLTDVCFISVNVDRTDVVDRVVGAIAGKRNVVLCVWSAAERSLDAVRTFIVRLMNEQIQSPVILAVESHHASIDEQLIHFSTESGALLLDGMGDGIWLIHDPSVTINAKVSGRTYLEARDSRQFINNTSFSILQATRTRISKTEYISCPSCGRTLFDLQETTARIRNVTNHLKGVKIAIMGCIVNGPGEMADADFGYVGSGPGKITLYKGKDVVKRSVSSDIAVEELVSLLKENGAWIEP